MNDLPLHRRAITGNVFSRSWSASDFDPFERCRRPTRVERVAGVLLAVALGIFFAAALVHWWAA